MRKTPALAIAATLLSGCAGEIYTFSRTPASIELGATSSFTDQQLADAAQAHCRAAQRDAVEVRRSYALMPNWADGRAVLYHCR